MNKLMTSYLPLILPALCGIRPTISKSGTLYHYHIFENFCWHTKCSHCFFFYLLRRTSKMITTVINTATMTANDALAAVAASVDVSSDWVTAVKMGVKLDGGTRDDSKIDVKVAAGTGCAFRDTAHWFTKHTNKLYTCRNTDISSWSRSGSMGYIQPHFASFKVHKW